MRRGRVYNFSGGVVAEPNVYWVSLDRPQRFRTWEAPGNPYGFQDTDRELVWADWWQFRCVGTPLFCRLFNKPYEPDPVG